MQLWTKLLLWPVNSADSQWDSATASMNLCCSGMGLCWVGTAADKDFGPNIGGVPASSAFASAHMPMAMEAASHGRHAACIDNTFLFSGLPYTGLCNSALSATASPSIESLGLNVPHGLD